MKLLAIDPSSTLVGLYASNKTAQLNLVDLCKSKAPKRAERLGVLAEALADFLQRFGPYDFVAYEEQFVRGNAATRALYGAVGVIEAVAETSGVGTLAVPQATLRSWVDKKLTENNVTPIGDAKKRYSAVDKILGGNIMETQDEKDAKAIWFFVMENAKRGK